MPDPLVASTWGEFQSLFQLSVALNAAFAVLHDVVPQARASRSHDLGERANRIGAHDLAAELFLLETRLSESAAKTENWIFKIIGPICLGFALVALGFLGISSFWYKDPIHYSVQIYAVVQFLPFLAGASLALRAAVYDNTSLAQQLQAYEAQLRVAERASQRS